MKAVARVGAQERRPSAWPGYECQASSTHKRPPQTPICHSISVVIVETGQATLACRCICKIGKIKVELR